MNNLYADVVVIGGGPAGMAAALSASKKGVKVLLLERNTKLGGILNQCIHAGFGLHYFKEEMTGPEYADRFRREVLNSDITVEYEAMAISISENGERKYIEYVSPVSGVKRVDAGAVVLAMGCRERSAGAIMLTGTRPAGIYTAGMAQKLCNEEGYLVGKRVVILGSGDIGLIMARRMTLEGAKVEAVIELMPYSSGLKRNIVQCLDDFDIPIYYAHTVTRVEGEPRLERIYFAPVDGNRKPDLSKEQTIECDTLLLSVGLIPENDLLSGTGVEMSAITGGAVVDESRMTSVKGIFSCGNVLHVHDLVDNVSVEAELAGKCAAEYAKFFYKADSSACNLKSNTYFNIDCSDGVRYVLPQRINKNNGLTVANKAFNENTDKLPLENDSNSFDDEIIQLYFRVDNVYKNVRLVAECGEDTIVSKKYAVLAPGEMESVKLEGKSITGDVRLRLTK